MFGLNATRRFRRVTVWASLIALGVVGCDSPKPPAACGTLPQVTINTGETTVVSACFNDPNGDLLTYSATSSNPAVATATAAGATVTVRAVSPGDASIIVTASDPDGLQGQQSFQVMVPNRPPIPVGSMPSVEVAVGETQSVSVSQYFSEPDDQALTFSATSSNPAVATVSVAGSTVTVAAIAKGVTNVTVTATDPGGLIATQTLEATVPNRAPQTVGAIADQTVHVGDTATLDVAAHFTDPDRDMLTYRASSSHPSVAAVSVSGSTVTIAALATGTATITVSASDPAGLTATQTLEATVPNRAPEPVGTIPDRTVEVGETVTLDLSPYFDDPDGDPLSYTVASSNPGVASGSVQGSSLTIAAVAAGRATLTVTARDQGGASATQRIRVMVPNRSPRRVGTIPAQTLAPGGTGTIDASRYFSDPDGDALGYTARSSNSGVARVSVSGSTVTITAVANGSATVAVTARDPGGLTARQPVVVTVSSDSGKAPDLVVESVSVSDASPAAGASFSLRATVRNRGDARSTVTTLRYYRSSNEAISTGDVEVGTDVVRGLDPSGTSAESINLQAPATAGTYFYGACVAAVAGESDQDNNCSESVRVRVRNGGSTAPSRNARIVSLTRDRGSITIVWRSVVRANYYKVNHCWSPSPPGICNRTFGYKVVADNVKDTTHVHGIQLPPQGITWYYYYIVQACNDAGCSSLASGSASAAFRVRHSAAVPDDPPQVSRGVPGPEGIYGPRRGRWPVPNWRGAHRPVPDRVPPSAPSNESNSVEARDPLQRPGAPPQSGDHPHAGI